jgi:alkaline phosphatase
MKLYLRIVTLLAFMCAAIAQNQPAKRVVELTDTAVNDTYTGCPATAITAYATGMEIRFLPSTDNIGAATINICSLGAIPIKNAAGDDPANGDIKANRYIRFVYDGTNAQIISPVSSYQVQYKEWTLDGGGAVLTAVTGNEKHLDRACKVLDIKVSLLPAGSATVVVEYAAATTGAPSFSTLATIALSSVSSATDTSAAGTALAAGTRLRANITGTPATSTNGSVFLRCQ